MGKKLLLALTGGVLSTVSVSAVDFSSTYPLITRNLTGFIDCMRTLTKRACERLEGCVVLDSANPGGAVEGRRRRLTRGVGDNAWYCTPQGINFWDVVEIIEATPFRQVLNCMELTAETCASNAQCSLCILKSTEGPVCVRGTPAACRDNSSNSEQSAVIGESPIAEQSVQSWEALLLQQLEADPGETPLPLFNGDSAAPADIPEAQSADIYGEASEILAPPLGENASVFEEYGENGVGSITTGTSDAAGDATVSSEQTATITFPVTAPASDVPVTITAADTAATTTTTAAPVASMTTHASMVTFTTTTPTTTTTTTTTTSTTAFTTTSTTRGAATTDTQQASKTTTGATSSVDSISTAKNLRDEAALGAEAQNSSWWSWIIGGDNGGSVATQSAEGSVDDPAFEPPEEDRVAEVQAAADVEEHEAADSVEEHVTGASVAEESTKKKASGLLPSASVVRLIVFGLFLLEGLSPGMF